MIFSHHTSLKFISQVANFKLSYLAQKLDYQSVLYCNNGKFFYLGRSFPPQVENKLKQFEFNLKTDFSFSSIPKFSEKDDSQNCVGAFDTWSYMQISPSQYFLWQIQLSSMSDVESGYIYICHSLIISREGLILTLPILPCPQGWTS